MELCEDNDTALIPTSTDNMLHLRIYDVPDRQAKTLLQEQNEQLFLALQYSKYQDYLG